MLIIDVLLKIVRLVECFVVRLPDYPLMVVLSGEIRLFWLLALVAYVFPWLAVLEAYMWF